MRPQRDRKMVEKDPEAVKEGKQVKVWKLQPRSFYGYLQKVADAYNSKAAPDKKVYTANSQDFPKFNKFLQTCVERYQGFMADQPQKTHHILSAGEVQRVYDQTDFKDPVEGQKFDYLIVGFRSGLRAETLRNLTWECLGDLDAEIVQPNIAHYKQNRGKLCRVDKEFFRQPMLRSNDPKSCIIEAFKRQKVRVENLQPDGRNWVFRKVSTNGKLLLKEQSSDNLQRSVAAWVSKNLPNTPQMEWKDMARRAVVTRLCNSGQISSASAAKFLGINTGVLPIYHKKNQ